MALQPGRTTDETRLIAACRKGGTSAFESLINGHQQMIFNIAFHLTGNDELASDLTRDTFVTAWRKISAFRGERQFSTWLTSIVINLSRNRLQQLQSSELHETSPQDKTDSVADYKISPDPPASPLDKREETDLRQALNSCIKKLPQEFREVIVLRDMQGLSYIEAAEILGVNEETIKSRLFRARDLIKECLRDAEQPSEA